MFGDLLLNLQVGIIWEDVRNGGQEAWVKLVRRYAGLVNTVALRVGLSALDAEDCAQHTWVALYRNRKVIRDPSKLPSWLIQTTRRHAMRMLQRQSRFSNSPLNVELISDNTLPDEELIRLERLDILQYATRQLDGRCQRLLSALFMSPENLSYREIAKAIKISPNSMGPLRSRCLRRLKKILEEMGYSAD